MNDDEHVQQTWQLANADGDEISIDLWVDDETVRVDGGDEESTEGGRGMVDRLLVKYQAAGYRLERDYLVAEGAPGQEGESTT